MNPHSTTLFGTVAPQLLVPDVTATVSFYRDKLGFKLSNIVGDPAEHAIVTRGNSQVFFARAVGIAATSNRRLTEAGFDAYFRVHGLQELHQSLLEHGVLVLEGPVPRDYGMEELVIEDLNGFVLVFGEDQP